MSKRDFNMISPAVWQSAKFAGLTVPQKLLHIYVLTSPHQTSAGGYRLPAGYATADMGCTAQDFEANLRELAEVGLVLHDPATKEVFVIGWFQHCPPTNLKHATGANKMIEKIASDAIRSAMVAEFAATEWGGKLMARNIPDNVRPLDSPNSLADYGNRLLSTDFMKGRK